MTKNKELAITASLNLIPYVGGSFASIYSKIKTDKEFERIYTFYNELANEIKNLDSKLKEIIKNNTHDDEFLTMFIEKISRFVESEARNSKINAFKQLFKNALLEEINVNSYSKIEFYLEILNNLSNWDIEILIQLSKLKSTIELGKLKILDIDDPYYILASVNKLRNFGLVKMLAYDVLVGSIDSAFYQKIKISNVGIKFIDYCISD